MSDSNILFSLLPVVFSNFFAATEAQYSTALSLYFYLNTDKLLIRGLNLLSMPSAGQRKFRSQRHLIFCNAILVYILLVNN